MNWNFISLGQPYDDLFQRSTRYLTSPAELCPSEKSDRPILSAEAGGSLRRRVRSKLAATLTLRGCVPAIPAMPACPCHDGENLVCS
jgi:hypothetical protein